MCIIYDSPRFIDTHTHTDTDAHTLLSGGLRGNRAERKLRAFAKQGLSGVMATGADYPTLHQSEREERRGEERRGEERRGEERGMCTITHN